MTLVWCDLAACPVSVPCRGAQQWNGTILRHSVQPIELDRRPPDSAPLLLTHVLRYLQPLSRTGFSSHPLPNQEASAKLRDVRAMDSMDFSGSAIYAPYLGLRHGHDTHCWSTPVRRQPILHHPPRRLRGSQVRVELLRTTTTVPSCTCAW